MTSHTELAYYYPNKMGRIVLLAMEELVGHNGMIAVLGLANLRQRLNNLPPNDLDLAFSFEEMGRLQGALESIYGPRSGRGLALRIGRACFKYGLREFGPLLGCMDLSFRLLPLETKLRTGADLFAEIFNRYTDQRVRIEEQESCFLWHIERCPVCWQRHSDSAVCHLAVGLLQEALYWASGGKSFHVEETACIAKGDPICTILIEKQSLD
jgi:predicted hydrocarbon binding protein